MPYAPASADELPKASAAPTHGDEQDPVDGRHVDLAGLARRREVDAHARQDAQLDRLARHRIGAGDHRLRCDHRGARRQRQRRHQPGAREEAKERVVERARVAHQERALAHVVEGERGQDDAGPGDLDRAPAEVAHVGVERLGAGEREDDRADRREDVPAALAQEVERAARVERLQDRRLLDDLPDAGGREHREPEQDDRPEGAADAARAVALDRGTGRSGCRPRSARPRA